MSRWSVAQLIQAHLHDTIVCTRYDCHLDVSDSIMRVQKTFCNIYRTVPANHERELCHI